MMKMRSPQAAVQVIRYGDAAGLDDLDQDNPDTANELRNWIKWLLNESGVDGLRVDTGKHVPKGFLKDFDRGIHLAIYWLLHGDLHRRSAIRAR